MAMVLGTSIRSSVQEQRGSVLLGTLMLTFVLTVIGFAMFDIPTVERLLVVGNQKVSQAGYAAEAGISRAQLFWEKSLTSSCGSVAAMPTFDDVWNAGATPTQLCTNATFGPATFSSVTATYTVTATRSSPLNCVVPSLPPGAASISATCVTVVSTACLSPADPKAPCVSVQADVAKVSTLTQTSLPSSLTTTTTVFIAKYPFFASDSIKLNSSQVVDSFDSKAGPYSSSKCQAVGCGADIRTNGTAGTVTDDFNKVGGIYGNVTLAKGEMKLGSSGIVYGDVTYDSSNASLDCGASCVPAHVKGTLTATTVAPVDMAVEMPAVPDCTSDTGAKFAGTPPSPCVLPACDPTRNHTTGYSDTSWVASQTTVNSGSIDSAYSATTGFWDTRRASLTLQPGTYCFGGPKFGDVAIPTGPNAPVVMKLNLDALFAGSLINTSGTSAYLQVLSSVDSSSNGVHVASNTDAYVYIYAPRAYVLVNGHGDIFGAVEARKLDSTGSGNLHFDKDLGRRGIILQGGTPKTVSTTTTITTFTNTTNTRYAQQLTRLCPPSGC